LPGPNFVPNYELSHALVIGINAYKSAPPLGFAVNDAQALARVLKQKYGFSEENVRLLLDDEASRSAIMDRFLSFASAGTGPNDRLIVFFAGHGHTERSRRGEVGFLVPCDGDPRNLASLIRWDELTRNADLIGAKHILFLMDACYGGLAITRALKPGSMRFIKDMLLRPARQALTAGKADEAIADLGGPLPDHSIFTGHLLEALQGKAADSEGLITANGVMAYVYQKVGRDPESHQTPHFGYLDGDGDLIFSISATNLEATLDARKDEDVLVSVPAVFTSGEGGQEMTIVERAKEYLSEDRYKLKLYELVAEEVREVISLTAEDHFAVQGSWSIEQFIERMGRYEEITKNLCQIQALLAFWGEPAHFGVLTLPGKHLCSRFKIGSGLSAWLALRWYPVLLLVYSAGIAAVAAERYDNLCEVIQANVIDPERPHRGEVTLVRAITDAISDLRDAFKQLPGHERQYTPRSEYLFKLLQPMLDDLLFLGPEYESSFDRFEVLYALEHAEQYSRVYDRVWGPPGRFGWKFQRGDLSSPFHRIVSEAEQQGASWPPIQAGFFQGSIDRFREIASRYSEALSKLGWL
jgi:hypothetical protein